MKVYVLEMGAYESRYVRGVYDSPERAMAAADGNWVKTTWTSFPRWPDRSVVSHWVSWDNDRDWDRGATVYEHELTTDGPLVSAASAVVQTYRESDGKWDYIPEPTTT